MRNQDHSGAFVVVIVIVAILSASLLVSSLALSSLLRVPQPDVARAAALSLGSFMVGALSVHLNMSSRLIIGLRRATDLVILFAVTSLPASQVVAWFTAFVFTLFVVQMIRLLVMVGHAKGQGRSLLI